MSADPHHPKLGRHEDTTKHRALECSDALDGQTAIHGTCTRVVQGSAGSPHYLGLRGQPLGWRQDAGGRRHSSPSRLLREPDRSLEMTQRDVGTR